MKPTLTPPEFRFRPSESIPGKTVLEVTRGLDGRVVRKYLTPPGEDESAEFCAGVKQMFEDCYEWNKTLQDPSTSAPSLSVPELWQDRKYILCRGFLYTANGVVMQREGNFEVRRAPPPNQPNDVLGITVITPATHVEHPEFGKIWCEGLRILVFSTEISYVTDEVIQGRMKAIITALICLRQTFGRDIASLVARKWV